jgi:hypothetical protein
MNPMAEEALVRLIMGATPVDIRGEMLYAALRYFDAARKQPGLPPDVGALITRLGHDSVDVELVNTNVFEERRVIVEGGSYGEHQITDVVIAGSSGSTRVDRPWFEVDLEPGAGAFLHIGMKRFASRPRYQFPWEK